MRQFGGVVANHALHQQIDYVPAFLQTGCNQHCFSFRTTTGQRRSHYRDVASRWRLLCTHEIQSVFVSSPSRLRAFTELGMSRVSHRASRAAPPHLRKILFRELLRYQSARSSM